MGSNSITGKIKQAVSSAKQQAKKAESYRKEQAQSTNSQYNNSIFSSTVSAANKIINNVKNNIDYFSKQSSVSTNTSTSNNKTENVKKLKDRLEGIRNEQGGIGSFWDFVKNLTSIGAGSNKAEQAIELYEKGEISYEEAEAAINDYQNGQDMCVDVAADLGSGVLAVGAFVLAVPSGGASLPVGLGLATLVGAGSKTAIKAGDAAVGGREYNSLVYDGATGAINGLLTPITNGLGASITKSIGEHFGLTIVKKGAEETFEQAAKTGLKSIITQESVDLVGGNIAQRVFADAAGMAVEGSIDGAADNMVRAALNGEDVREAGLQGALFGFLFSPLIGGSFKLAGKAGTKLNEKITSNELFNNVLNKLFKKGDNLDSSFMSKLSNNELNDEIDNILSKSIDGDYQVHFGNATGDVASDKLSDEMSEDLSDSLELRLFKFNNELDGDSDDGFIISFKKQLESRADNGTEKSLLDKTFDSLSSKQDGKNIDWVSVMKDEYDRIREHGDYAVDYGRESFVDSVEDLQEAVVPGYKNYEDYGISFADVAKNEPWVAKGNISENVTERISANVKGSVDLIDRLEKFMKTGEYIDADGQLQKVEDLSEFYFKVPRDVETWGNRQDPITFYFSQDVNEQTFNAIQEITAPYARGEVYNPSSSASWLSNITPEPNKDSINQLYKELSEFDSSAAVIMQQRWSANKQRMSAGEFEAWNNILNKFKQQNSAEVISDSVQSPVNITDLSKTLLDEMWEEPDNSSVFGYLFYKAYDNCDAFEFIDPSIEELKKGISFEANSERFQSLAKTNIPNLTTTSDGQGVRGACILGKKTKKFLPNLQDSGIKRVIDLRAESNVDAASNLCSKYDLDYVFFPIPYGKPVGQDFVDRLPEFISAMQKGEYYIGCGEGTNRTDVALGINYLFNPNANATPIFEAKNPQKSLTMLFQACNQMFKNDMISEETVKELGWSDLDTFLAEFNKRKSKITI